MKSKFTLFVREHLNKKFKGLSDFTTRFNHWVTKQVKEKYVGITFSLQKKRGMSLLFAHTNKFTIRKWLEKMESHTVEITPKSLIIKRK